MQRLCSPRQKKKTTAHYARDLVLSLVLGLVIFDIAVLHVHVVSSSWCSLKACFFFSQYRIIFSARGCKARRCRLKIIVNIGVGFDNCTRFKST